MRKKYGNDFDIRLTNYTDEYVNFKSTMPISKEDKILVEHLKGLSKKIRYK